MATSLFELPHPWVVWAERLRLPVSRILWQLRSVLNLREATEALEVEDYNTAERLFVTVIATDASRSTRLMAYHGAVIARLRLGRYQEALELANDARVLLITADPAQAPDEAERSAGATLDEARRFAEWAVSHPRAAAKLQEQERREKEAHAEEQDKLESIPLGWASTWPESMQLSYRLVVHGVMAAGLVAAAADRLASAKKLLHAALLAARYDRRIERDVYWHLSRVAEQLGLGDEARRHREQYEQLNEKVRITLRRLRWTN